jgi:hypothetical protein
MVLVIPGTCTVPTHARTFRAFFYPTTTIKKHYKMKGTGDIDGAIAEIERQKATGEALNL